MDDFSIDARREASSGPKEWPLARRLRRPLAVLVPLLALSGCPTTVATPDAAIVGDAGPMPDAFRADAATSDGGRDAASPDSAVADGGTDADIDAAIDDAGSDSNVDAPPPRPAPVLTASEMAILATLTALPALPPDPTNAHADDPAAAALGHALFFDARYSGPITAGMTPFGVMGETGRVSCASCHGSQVMSDATLPTSPTSIGTAVHARNAPAVVNSAYYQWTNWGGRFSAQWELPPIVAEAGATMNSSRLAVVHHIFDNYRTQYEAVFGAMDPAIADTTRFPLTARPAPAGSPPGPWEMMAPADRTIVLRIFMNYGMAIQAYMRQLVSRTSAFDRFAAGNPTAISVDAQWGLRVFMGEGGCVDCHSGPTFSDDQFHNIGVPQTGATIDHGRFSSIGPLLASPLNAAGVYSSDPAAGAALLTGLTDPPPESTRGQFRTPTLRDLEFTAPFMHNGAHATLDAVITFYEAGGATPPSGTLDPLIVPLSLEAQERADLLAFLMELDSDVVPVALRTAP